MISADHAPFFDVLVARVEDLEASVAALQAIYARIGPSDDVALIVEQTQKARTMLGEIRGAEPSAAQVALHRLNNYLTGALSLAGLAREDATNQEAIAAIDDVLLAGRGAADAVRRVSAALKG